MSVVANVAINVDSRDATQKLRAIQGQAQQTERAFGGLTAAAGKLAAAFSAIQAAKFVFVKTAELESQARSLQVLTGNAEKAGQIIKDLQRLGDLLADLGVERLHAALEGGLAHHRALRLLGRFGHPSSSSRGSLVPIISAMIFSQDSPRA